VKCLAVLAAVQVIQKPIVHHQTATPLHQAVLLPEVPAAAEVMLPGEEIKMN
jgi:hypothetical protein